MKCLGLDPSLTAFGWSLHDDSFPVGDPRRLILKGLFKTKSDMVFVDRYVLQRQRVIDLVREHTPDCVGMESTTFGDQYSEGMYGLFLYTNEALRICKCDVAFWSPSQPKSHAHEFLKRPKGWKMEKPEMIAAAKKDTGISKWNHNEADAYLIAKLSARFWGFQKGVLSLDELTPVEKRMFSDVHTYTRGKKAGTTVHNGILFKEDSRFFQWSKVEEENGTKKKDSTR